ncbi:MAG TPA: tRNA 2-thiouridine(34) synthase MnmA [Candidatus Nanopelagicaceae bacterium]|nr:tRNA 2-thiouridine(34) synthase MnmA [Candidatus Nanopelagicaceae bacterium]
MRVIAAMSGGVDSAVAAARAVDAGHEVVGVHLALSANPQAYRSGARGCCTIEDSRDARRAADLIGIPFYIWDMAEEFRAEVVEDFIAEYSSGNTPNPCLRCNEKIKFEAVLNRSLAMGFDAVATGHYAQIVDGPSGRTLHRAVDEGKDQSYVLAVLDEKQLAHAYFPLGDTTKELVRKEAEKRGLAVANKPDSHDICFIPSGDNAGWLRDRLGTHDGPIVDEMGEVIGTHHGAFTYTVGQRKGLGVEQPTVDGRPRYVLRIEPVSNTVVVGAREALAVSEIVGERPRYNGIRPEGVRRGFAQVRAHGTPLPCSFECTKLTISAKLDEPLLGLATGQALVVYEGDQVVGAATISHTQR